MHQQVYASYGCSGFQHRFYIIKVSSGAKLLVYKSKKICFMKGKSSDAKSGKIF